MIADALAFLRDARRDETLQRGLHALDDSVTWADLAELAGRNGYRCSAAELEQAHALDWGLRWARLGADTDAS